MAWPNLYISFFPVMQIMQILATLVSRIFVFVSASLNCPDFLSHIIIVVGPNFITAFILI